MAKEVHDFLYKGDIDPKQTVTGIGGWTTGIFSGRWMRANRPDKVWRALSVRRHWSRPGDGDRRWRRCAARRRSTSSI